ncbi:MAG: TPM domain-containing protein, partial [Proteobacteria bacterium]
MKSTRMKSTRTLINLPACLCLVLATATVLSTSAWSDTKAPAGPVLPNGRLEPVVDQANLFSDQEKLVIEERLRALKKEANVEMAIFTTPSLDGLPLEQYSLKIAEAWKLGEQKTDRGLLFLIAPQDRKMRMEVGRGLEGDIPDLATQVLMNEIARPEFRSAGYAQG